MDEPVDVDEDVTELDDVGEVMSVNTVNELNLMLSGTVERQHRSRSEKPHRLSRI
jgi:hypothetical protein